MKKYTLLVLMSLLPFHLISQNLVPNWSFEDTVSCPYSAAQIIKAAGWEACRNSPDYFNSCNNGLVSVPLNYSGYQYSKTGNANAGILCYPFFREWMGIQLSQPLLIGQSYTVKFYICLSIKDNAAGFNFNTAINKIGARLSTIPYSSSQLLPLNGYAHIYTDTIVTDTLNWHLIEGSFIADSAYNYIIIGNFFNDSTTSFTKYDTIFGYSYYYIDDISVEKSLSGIVNELNENLIQLLPDYSSGIFKLKNLTNKDFELTIYSENFCRVWHSIIKKSDKTIDLTAKANGVYFAIFKFNNEIMYKKIMKF